MRPFVRFDTSVELVSADVVGPRSSATLPETRPYFGFSADGSSTLTRPAIARVLPPTIDWTWTQSLRLPLVSQLLLVSSVSFQTSVALSSSQTWTCQEAPLYAESVYAALMLGRSRSTCAFAVTGPPTGVPKPAAPVAQSGLPSGADESASGQLRPRTKAWLLRTVSLRLKARSRVCSAVDSLACVSTIDSRARPSAEHDHGGHAAP